jgi:3' exoribonuclease, RNase T-like
MWIDCQIDIETMGLPPNGAIVSIGACFFSLDTCEIGPTFKKNIHLATAVRDGGVIEASTVLWWLRQSDAARQSILVDTYDIRQVLQEFSDWIATHSDHRSVRPWGNGVGFDLTILNSAYRRSGITTPWYFGNERDFRTVRNMYPSVEYQPDDKGDGAHDALVDAIFQAKHLFKIKLRNRDA